LYSCCCAPTAQAGHKATVIGVDHIAELVAMAVRNVGKHHAARLTSGAVEFRLGDGRLGLPTEAPFDCIHVGA